MKKNNDWFWIPCCFALIFGAITGGIYKRNRQFQTNDWAASQPLFERWLDNRIWFIEGAIPGAIVGLIVGILLWWVYADKKEKTKNLDDNSDNNGEK